MVIAKMRLIATAAAALSVALVLPAQGTIAAPPSKPASSQAIPPGQTEESVKIKIPKSGQSLNDALSELPPARNSEGSLQPMTIKLLRLIETIYPYYGNDGVIGGYRQDAINDHPSGQALDIMMRGGAKSEQDTIEGHQIAAFLMINARELGVKYMVWRQHIWYPGREWRKMGDRSNWTHNHMDHVHVLVDGSHTPEGILVMPGQIRGVNSLPTSAALEKARQERIAQVTAELKVAKKSEKEATNKLQVADKSTELSLRSFVRQIAKFLISPARPTCSAAIWI